MMQDIRYAGRWLFRNPLFTMAIVLTMALAIGANTAIFSAVNAALFPPLPYEDSDRLVEIWEVKNRITIADYEELWRLADFLESAAAYKVKVWHFAGLGEPARIPGYSISSTFLSTLRVQPVIGRNFTIQEDKSGTPFVVLISDEMWRAVFAADPKILGKVIRLDDQPCEIIGVMDAHFRFPNFPVRQPQFWTTLGYEKAHLSATGGRRVFTIGRLKPGITMVEAQEKLNRIAGNFKDRGYKFKINRLNEYKNRFRGMDVSILFLVSAAVLLVLMIACANISNLLLSRAVTRNKEIAIRIALGASRRRLSKLLLTESLLLCSIGGVAGFLLTVWLQNSLTIWMASVYPMAMNYWTGVYPSTINSRVLLATIVLTILTGIITGLAPAFHASITDLHAALKDGIQTSSRDLRSKNFHNFFVVLQFALAIVLLIGAALMLQSVNRLQGVNPGFDPNFVQMYVPLPSYKYPEPDQWRSFSFRVLERVQALQGVRHAAVASDLPLNHAGKSVTVRLEDQPNLSPDEEPWIYYSSVSPDFFASVGAVLLNGRTFLETEDERSPAVVVINEMFARKFWPDKDPIGKRIHLSFDPPVFAEVIGVVRDMKQHLDVQTEPEVYIPYRQQPHQWINVAVRGDFRPASMIPTLSKIIWSIDKSQPIFNVESTTSVIHRSTEGRRTTMYLLSFFAIVAVCLSIVGVYSVVSYSISRQTHEIGIRMSLGAGRSDVIKMILKKASYLILTGTGIGLILSFLLSRTLETVIYGISRNDPSTYIFASALVIAVALIASVVPAMRAANIDPVIALREE